MSKSPPIPRSVPNGANYWADVQKTALSRKKDNSQLFYDSAMVDGRPPLTVQNSELGMWQRLSMMRQTGDPGFWNSPEAQQAYAQLSLKFGGAPPTPAVPYGAIGNMTV